jgi:hypothetical protein
MGGAFPQKTSVGRGARATTCCADRCSAWAGIIANDPPEAMYLNTAFDEKGDALTGSKRYVMRFESAQLIQSSARGPLTANWEVERPSVPLGRIISWRRWVRFRVPWIEGPGTLASRTDYPRRLSR